MGINVAIEMNYQVDPQAALDVSAIAPHALPLLFLHHRLSIHP
jgi:hypothetical protein